MTPAQKAAKTRRARAAARKAAKTRRAREGARKAWVTRRADGNHMTSDEYRHALSELGLSQMQAAPFLGVAPRTSQSFALGEATVHRSIALLLRTMVTHELTAEDIEKMPKVGKAS